MTCRTLPRFSGIGALFLGVMIQAQAQPNYLVSEITVPDWPNEVKLADMDGDERTDVLIPFWSQDAGRELLVHLQDARGRYSPQVSRRVEIKQEIVAVALADVRVDPGNELILFSNASAFSVSSAIPSYTGNLEKLFDWDLIASVPEKRETRFIDIVSDPQQRPGITQLLLPGREQYGVFHGNAEGFRKVHTFGTENPDLDPAAVPAGGGRFSTNVQINAQDGIVLEVVAEPNSSFVDLVAEWDATDAETLLQSSTWMPAAAVTKMSAQSQADIVYLNIGNDIRGQLNILLQDADGSYPPQPSWQGPIDTEGEIQLLDFSGDGLTDVLRIVDNGDEWDVFFYRNQGGSFDFDSPDQIMRFAGYDLNIAAADIDQDQRPELSVSYYTIPVVNAIRNTSIVRTQLLYGVGSNQPFNSRPDFRLDESFAANAVRGLSEQINLEADLNGDGRLDAIYLTAEGTLAARSIDSSYRMADAPFWQHVPARTIAAFDIVRLNDDNVPDLILYHSNSISILVSAP